MGLADDHNTVSPRYHEYLLERARGGAGLIGMESAPVTPGISNRSLRIRLYEDQVVEGLAKLATAVQGAGSALSITLWHGGHTESFMRGRYAVSPSAIPNMAGEIPKVISKDEIEALIDDYAAAAERCRLAGLDAVELQTSTNYLLGSFLNPTLNHRDDEFGGPRENRMRIVLRILKAMRDRVGDALAIGVRTSVTHGIPGAPEDYDEQESLACMMLAADSGHIDWVHIMKGSNWSMGQSIPAMHAEQPQLAAQGRRFREALSVPLITSGNIRTPRDAEQLLMEGAADAVSMARSWIAEPQWARKVSLNQPIRPCTSCNQGCVGFVWRGIPGTCVLNPRAGREIDLPPLGKANVGKELHVVGGGPAGMESARLAAIAGHRVTLHEQSSQLGGALRLAAKGPTRERWYDAITWWETELQGLGVDIRLNQSVDANQPPGEWVIWATGAVPSQIGVLRLRPFLRNGIPGSKNLVHGRTVMAEETPPKGNILVIDEEGGWPTVSLVEWLATGSGKITVVTTERGLGESQLQTTFDLGALSDRLSRIDLELIPSTRVDEVNSDDVLLSNGQRLGHFDLRVLSTGASAMTTPAGSFAVGDCVAPRGIWGATNDAAHLIREHFG